MIAYQETESKDTVVRLSDGELIPATDPRNEDCARYLLWLKSGNVPLPAESTSREALISKVKSAIDAWSISERDAGFEWNGLKFQSDAIARESLLSIHAGGVGTAFGFWKDAENNLVPDGSAAMVANLVRAMNERGEEIFARKQAMKAAIPTLTDSQLELYAPSW